MSIINFTVEYDLLASITDGPDGDIDSDLVPLIGDVLFTPQFADNRAILAPDYEPRPTGFKLLPVVGYIGSGGRLLSARNGTVGVRLPANDPVLGLQSLTYLVTFRLTTPLGEPVPVASGYFQAPPTDTVIQLAEVLQSAGYLDAPRLIGGEFVGDTIIFENYGGTKLLPITIPDGVVVFVDNHDSTWSAG